MNVEQRWLIAGWTMIHFLWIGGVLTLVLGMVRIALRRLTPQVKYVVTCVCFAALAAVPVAIAAWLARDMDWVATSPADLQTETAMEQEPLSLAVDGQAHTEQVVIDLAKTPVVMEPEPAAAVASEPNPIVAANPALTSSPLEPASQPAIKMFDQLVGYLPWLWVVGAPLTFLLLATGLVGSQRLRSRAETILDGPMHEAASRLRVVLRISREVTVAVCDRVLQPVLVGILRPVILMPPAAINGWSPQQIEMALLHELAHVRRHDNLANLIQRMVEAVLFFHPCVWMMSHWLRADREQCCDAIVVRHTGAREAYADLLVSVARDAGNHRLPSAAVALSSHPLARRVRRILQLEDDPMVVPKRTLCVVGLTLATVVAAALWQGQPTSVAEETGDEPGASATGENAGEALEEDNRSILSPRLEATGEMVSQLQELVAEGRHFGLGVTDNGRFVLIGMGEPGNNASELIDDEEAEKRLWKLILKATSNNPVMTRTHAVPQSMDAETLKIATDLLNGLQKDPYGPRLDFDWEVVNGGEGLSIRATKAAHWLFEQVLLTIAEDESIGRTSLVAEESTGELGAAATGATASDDGLSTEGEVDAELDSSATAPATNLPFLPLEQQRIADLAYKMLSMEVAPLDDKQLKAVKEKGFVGGVVVAEIPDNGGAFLSRPKAAGIERGDILVGLHVWETPHFETLGTVLRRDDLDQFNPLKYYVLREVTDEEAIRKREQERERSREGRSSRGGGFGGEFGGGDDFGGGGFGGEFDGGGEFGGGGFEGEFGRGGGDFGGGGFGMGRGGGRRRPIARGGEVQVPTKLKLITGRMSFDNEAWLVEQSRLKRVEQKQSDEEPNFRNIGVGRETSNEVGVPLLEVVDEPTKPKLTLLYDGRTFDDWRTQWKNELKTENRTDAIKALRAFGRAGHGKEATETILDVAEEYSMTSISSTRSPTAALETAIAYSFINMNDSNPIPGDASLPVIVPWYNERPQDRRLLVWWVLSLVTTSDADTLQQVAKLAADGPSDIRQSALCCLVNSDPELKLEFARDALKTHMADEDEWVVVNALKMLTTPVSTYPMQWNWGNHLRDFMPDMLPLLFHGSLKVRQAARRTLGTASHKQLGDSAELLAGIAEEPKIVKVFGDTQLFDATDSAKVLKNRKLAAIRALAALGPHGKPTYDVLMGLLDSDDYEVQVAAYVALERMFIEKSAKTVPQEVYQRVNKVFELATDTGELNGTNYNRLEQARKAEQSIIAPPIGGGGFGGGGGGFGGGGQF